ncbi:MAG: heme exporter protein CcmD [Anaerolineae bacterium]|nr:heme exporter protein CcmD [Anaerolineae bacterium]
MGDYAEYMILGYALMGAVLGGMVARLVWRWRALRRELARIEQIEAEERGENAP